MRRCRPFMRSDKDGVLKHDPSVHSQNGILLQPLRKEDIPRKAFKLGPLRSLPRDRAIAIDVACWEPTRLATFVPLDSPA